MKHFCPTEDACYATKSGKKWVCAEKTGAPTMPPTAPTVFSCENEEPEKQGRSWVCPSDTCVLQGKGKKGKCVDKTAAPTMPPTAPTVFSCENEKPEKRGKKYVCPTENMCYATKSGKKWVCEGKTEPPVDAPTNEPDDKHDDNSE